MCLAYPGKVIKIKNKRAVVDFDGIFKEVNIELVKRLKVGDWVNIHAGFAIQKLTQKDAREVLNFFSQNEKAKSKPFKKNKNFGSKDK